VAPRKPTEIDGTLYEGTRPHLIMKAAEIDELNRLADIAGTTLSGLIGVVVARWLRNALAYGGSDELRRLAEQRDSQLAEVSQS